MRAGDVVARFWRSPPQRGNLVHQADHGIIGRISRREVYRSRCWSADKLLHRLTVRQEAYIEGIVKNRGPDYAAAVVAATERYVISLADLDVATAVQRVNQDSGYRPAGAVAAYRESTSC